MGIIVSKNIIKYIFPVLLCASILYIFCAFCILHLSRPRYSPDSWAYYELSKSVFIDFYRFNTWRQFWSDNPYSNSFPPAWPVIIAIVDAVTGIGPRTGSILSALAVLAAAFVAEWVARHHFKAPWCGLVAIIIVLGSTATMECASGGRTETTAILVAISCMGLITANRINVTVAISIGFVSGFGVLLRFDWLPCAILLPIVIRLLSHGWRPTFAYFVVLGLMISPWIIFSMNHFETVFASDNRSVVLAVDPQVFVTDWRPDGVTTIFEDPVRWFEKIIHNILPVIKMWYYLIFEKTPFLIIVAILVFLAFILNIKNALSWFVSLSYSHNRIANRDAALFAFMLVFVGMFPIWLVSGYTDARYALPMLACALLASLIWMSKISDRIATQSKRFGILGGSRLILILGIAASAVVISQLGRVPVTDPSAAGGVRGAFDRSAFPDEVRCLVGLNGESTLLVFGAPKLAAQFGALTGWPTSFEPTAMTMGQDGLIERRLVTEFLKTFRIGVVWLADSLSWERQKAWGLPLKPIPGCTLPMFQIDHRQLQAQKHSADH